MWLFPLLAALVSVVFTAALFRQWAQRRHLFQGLWTISLAMYALASFAMFLGVLNSWSAVEFRVYWLFGAVLTVPYLAVGEAYLLIKNGTVLRVLLTVLAMATVLSALVILSADVNTSVLEDSLPLGKDVFGQGSMAYRLAQVFAYPAYIFVVAGSVWSVSKMRKSPEMRDRSAGTILIAVGATVVAIGSGVGAGMNQPWLFAISLAIGVGIMFGGFLRASGARRSPTPQSPETFR